MYYTADGIARKKETTRITPHDAPSTERNVNQPLPRTFYERPTLLVARALVGMTLLRRTAEGVAAGVIVETEAYIAPVDAAAHGYLGMTPRNHTMFGPAGHAYVYVSYGMHHCVNVVTETPGCATAVLVRALEPTQGIDLMRARRGVGIRDRDLARGPGRLCQALAIPLALDGADLTTSDDLWLAETPGFAPTGPIVATPRIGITRGVELPWRFVLANNPYVSVRRARA